MRLWAAERSMKVPAGIMALTVGAWGISLALRELYDSLFLSLYTDPISFVIIVAVLINSLATCWLGVRALADRRYRTVPSSPVAMRPRALTTNRILGFLLLTTGVACILYILFVVYLIYWLRSVLPWNDPEEPLAVYRVLDVLITSICAGWFGLKLVRRKADLQS